jgi:NADH-quinone oxidoreductase subunit J
VMVYIGGIMIFVLYAVLLTSELAGRMSSPSPLKIGLALMVAAIAMGSLGGLAKRVGSSAGSPCLTADCGPAESGNPDVAPARNIASMKTLGALMLDPKGFLIPFELVSVLLLAAMVGAIAVARGEKGEKIDRLETGEAP